MEAAVKANEVTKPKRRLIVKLRGKTREAPTITAKPIIKQFNGLINRRNPLSFPILPQLSILLKSKHEQLCHTLGTSYNHDAFRFISDRQFA